MKKIKMQDLNFRSVDCLEAYLAGGIMPKRTTALIHFITGFYAGLVKLGLLVVCPFVEAFSLYLIRMSESVKVVREFFDVIFWLLLDQRGQPNRFVSPQIFHAHFPSSLSGQETVLKSSGFAVFCKRSALGLVLFLIGVDFFALFFLDLWIIATAVVLTIVVAGFVYLAFCVMRESRAWGIQLQNIQRNSIQLDSRIRCGNLRVHGCRPQNGVHTLSMVSTYS